MADKNLYNKLSKKKRLADKYNLTSKEIVIKESNTLIKLLSFFCAIISKILKVIFYLAIVCLCSLGATYLINNILNIKIF